MEEPPVVKHNTTSIEIDIFHQLGHLRHSLSNTDNKRSTDRSTLTERRQSHDLAVNTEPKIMYSKDVGDFDVRHGDERRFVQHEEYTYSSLHNRPTMLERGFQTELFDTHRDVGYVERQRLLQQEETVDEQLHELLTIRLPVEQLTTEEIYETTITTETTENNRQYEEIRIIPPPPPVEIIDETTTTMKSELIEWTRSMGSHGRPPPPNYSQHPEKQRSTTPEELVEESYEVVSTCASATDGSFLITSASPRATVMQRYGEPSTSKVELSEEDGSYREEWTVTDAKHQHDGQTVKTIIDR